MKRQKIIIIGAGIGGLATANLLAKAGHEVHVYESLHSAGGRAGTLSKDGFIFDTGPSWYLMPKVFEHYYDLLDKKIIDELHLTKLAPAYRVFFEHDEPITITGSLHKDALLFEKIETGSGSWLKKYIRESDEIYQLSLKHFLYSNFANVKDFIKYDLLKRSLKMGQLALTPIHRYIARSIHDRRLQQILEYPMVFLGTSPFSAPALYSLMSALDFKEGVFYPQGGIYKIIESLQRIAEELGVTIHYNAPVKQIIVKNDIAVGIKTGNKKNDADIVISNADLHFTETQLLSPAHQSYAESYWKKQQAGPSALLMYLGVKGKLPKLTHHNLLFVDDWKKNFKDIYSSKTVPKNPSIYISKPSETDRTVAPKGHENVFILVPLPSGVSVSQSSLQHLADQYLLQIEKMTGVSLIDRIVTKTLFGPNDFGSKFHSWQNTALGPSHILKQSAFFRTPNKSKQVSNLYYVGGSTVPGIGLPMCLIGAELVFKRILGDNRSGQLKEIPKVD